MDMAEEGQEDAIDWQLWLERGSWFVLFAGIGGIAVRTIPIIFFTIFDRLRFFNQGLELNPSISVWGLFHPFGQLLYESAIVVALFLLLRLLIIGVPVLVELKQAVVGEDGYADESE